MWPKDSGTNSTKENNPWQKYEMITQDWQVGGQEMDRLVDKMLDKMRGG